MISTGSGQFSQPSPPEFPGAGLNSPSQPEPKSALTVIDDRLRGRMKLTIGLGLLLGTVLAVAGYRLTPVRYSSLGSIHVASSGQEILRETADTAYIRRYDGMRKTKEQQVTSPRVIDMALRDPDVAVLPFALEEDAFKTLTYSLSTETELNSELITVKYEADTPLAALTVLDAVLRSFESIYGNKSGGNAFRGTRFDKLHENRNNFRRLRSDKRQELQDLIARSDFGATNIEPILQAKLTRIETLNQDLEQLDLALADIPIPPTEAPEAATEIEEPTLAQIDLLEPDLPGLRRQYEEIELRITQLAGLYGARHQEVRRAVKSLDLVRGRIQLRENSARKKWYESGGEVENLDSQLGGMLPAQLKKRRASVAALLARKQQEVRDLNNEQIALQDLQQELSDIEERLGEFDQAIYVLTVEKDAQFSGWVTIVDWGILPHYASKDRRKPMAVIGFVGGFSLSFGLFFLLGTIDRRTYSVSQLQQNKANYRCLGVLPYLGSGQISAELSETAAQCVHQIRNRIEAIRPQTSGYMLVVTSPYQGDGKTSLSMSLGWSYAAAGYRTLLIDCDLHGRSLTNQMGLSGHDGVREVLRDRRLENQVVDLPVPNLSVMGCGHDPTFGPESIRRDDFEAMCGELRGRFDIIIADTGPFIGSVELLPVAAAANNVLFSVRRGRSRNRLDECLEDLNAIQVPCLGVVLNCADRSDCNRYVSKSTVSLKRLSEGEDEGKPRGSEVIDHNALMRAMENASSAKKTS